MSKCNIARLTGQVTQAGLLMVFSCLTSAAPIELVTAAQDSRPKYILKDGQMKGLCVDVILAMQAIEPTISFAGYKHFVPLARISAGLVTGAYDAFFCLAKTPARSAQLIVIEPAIYFIGDAVAVRADDDLVIEDVADLAKLAPTDRAIALFGSAQAARLQEIGIKVETATNYAAVLKMLELKRGRIIVANRSSLAAVLKDSKLGRSVKILPVNINNEGRYLMLHSKLPPVVVSKLRAAMELLNSSGELKRIANRYPLE